MGAGDSVVEMAGEGTDLGQSAMSFTLSANLENLILLGADAINCIGNEIATYGAPAIRRLAQDLLRADA